MTASNDLSSRTRSVAWAKDEPFGAEHAELEIATNRMRATGTAIGSDPVAYRLDYTMETGPDFVTSRVTARSRGEGWDRRIVLERAESGHWTCAAERHGDELDLPPPGGEMSQFDRALDPDLALSPVFNSMPVLRHRLLEGGEAPELLMVWISTPDLAVYPSVQHYSFNRAMDDGSYLIHFGGPDPKQGDFVADVVFDADGVVIDYPGIATRIR